MHPFRKRLRVSQSVISRLQQRHRETGRVTESHRSGRPLATSHAGDRFIVNSALRNRVLNATQLQAHLREVRGIRVSCQTIRNRLHQHGLHHRLAWAREHLCWMRSQKLLFSNTTIIYILLFQSLCLCMSNTGLISSSWMTVPQLIKVASSGNGCWRLGYLKWSGLVLFSDESRFTLSRNYGGQCCWRCQGERYASATVVTRCCYSLGRCV
uniref:Transposase Tc1-like domain-containing protein n=1 Tax=Sinocyclocheilus rhinocerous TaxID=307959 RepID=A0A673HIB9_9TELE